LIYFYIASFQNKRFYIVFFLFKYLISDEFGGEEIEADPVCDQR